MFSMMPATGISDYSMSSSIAQKLGSLSTQTMFQNNQFPHKQIQGLLYAWITLIQDSIRYKTNEKIFTKKKSKELSSFLLQICLKHQDVALSNFVAQTNIKAWRWTSYLGRKVFENKITAILTRNEDRAMLYYLDCWWGKYAWRKTIGFSGWGVRKILEVIYHWQWFG